MPWHPVPRRAFCTYLRAGASTCSRLISYVFYKETALFFGFYSGFTRGEYHIALVDFIIALRRTKGRGRRTLRSPPSPSSGLHLIHPGNPLRRGTLAAAVDRDIGSLYLVQVDNPQFRILFGYLCSGCGRSRFSRVAQLVSLVFHYWGIGRLCLRLLVVLLWIFVGFALTAIGSFLWTGNGMLNLCCSSLDCMESCIACVG